MRIRMAIVGVLAVRLCACLPLCAEGPADVQQPDSVQQEVQRLIEDLDDDQYPVREAATDRLIQIGHPAIAPLVVAAGESSLEVTNRAVRIFLELFHAQDDATVNAAEEALEKLAFAKRPSTSRRAAAALKSKAEFRHQRAVHRLTKLKAMIRSFGLGPSPLKYPVRVDVWLDKDWQGGEEGLQVLKRLFGMNVLYLVEGCPVSEKAVLALGREIPGLKVEQRGAACLGLGSGRPLQKPGVFVRQVTAGGSIMSAGLKPGDVITKYMGKPVDKFEQLVNLIKKNHVGETVAVEYLRRGTSQTAQVKLKSWREVFGLKNNPTQPENDRDPVPK